MGLDTDRAVDYIDSELICPICDEIVEDPVECSHCEKAFCRECIQDWSSRKSECPYRCPKLDLRSSHRFFRSLHDSVLIKCVRFREGCNAVEPIANIKKHEMLECDYRPVICEHSGCNQEVCYKDYQQHLLECKFKEITCEKCGQVIKICDTEKHSCLIYLKEKAKRLREITRIQETKIERLEKTLYSAGMEQIQIHIGISCNDCLVSPIQGIRFKCSKCVEYNLCNACKEGSMHHHSDFIKMSNSDLHEGVTCDECQESPIQGLRYKCKHCTDFGKEYDRSMPYLQTKRNAYS